MKAQRGYSLLEALVAMIVFAIITLATAFAIQNGMRAQLRVNTSADDTQEARTIIAILARDIRSAIVSASNPNTFFVATGDRAGQMLTFTTFSQRLLEDPPQEDTADTDLIVPQSDVMAVSYFLDPDTGQLSRSYSAIPNPQLMPEPGSPGTLLSARVRSLEFQFVDPQSGLRNEWSYIPQTTSNGNGQANTEVTQSGDTYLPSAVQITLEMLGRDYRPQRYTCAVSLTSPMPMPAGQQPDPPATSTGGQPGGTGDGGTGGGGGPGGGGFGDGGGAGPRSVIMPRIPAGALPTLPGAGGLVR